MSRKPKFIATEDDVGRLVLIDKRCSLLGFTKAYGTLLHIYPQDTARAATLSVPMISVGFSSHEYKRLLRTAAYAPICNKTDPCCPQHQTSYPGWYLLYAVHDHLSFATPPLRPAHLVRWESLLEDPSESLRPRHAISKAIRRTTRGVPTRTRFSGPL